MKTELDTARHEAAHAFSAWATGCRLAYLTISGPMLDYCGAHAYSRQKYPLLNTEADHLYIDDIRARAVAHLAPAAIGAVHPWPDVYGLMKVLTWGTPEGREMAKSAADLLEQFPHDPESAAKAFYDRFKADTLAVVDNDPAKKAIDELSKELAGKGRMSGFDVAHFIEKTWAGPLPEKVLPAGDHLTSLDSKTATDADNLQSARRLIKMAFDIIPLVDATESARESVLQAIFLMAGVEL